MSNTFARDPSPRIQYSGDGNRTIFGFPFPVLASDDLLVFVNDTPAAGFAIAGLADPGGGEIAFLEPPAAGSAVTLLRRTESVRETEFVDGTPFRAAAINAELDRIMLLVQETRDEVGRALRGGPSEGDLDFSLPAAAQRANALLGFDSAGRPMVFGQADLPESGDASGLLVTPSGGTTARALGEHLAAVVNVRDFGAMGDGVTDDAAAFAAAILAAETRSSPVYVPASATPYVVGAPLTLDSVTLVGEGAGSTLKLAASSGSALQVMGTGPRLSGLRLLGPGVNGVPGGPADVDLSAVSLEGITIAAGAENTVLQSIEVVGCQTGAAIEGAGAAIIGCRFAFNRTGLQLRNGVEGAIFLSQAQFHGCTSGILADADAAFAQLGLCGGTLSACGRALELDGAAAGWRGIELSDLTFGGNLDTDVEAGARQSVGLRGCHLDASGKRSGKAVDLKAGGETVEAPNLIAEDVRAEVTQVVTVQLSGGTNLNLLQPGDLIVLASDADDVDDHWTALKATRAGVVHKVVTQTSTTAQIELGLATIAPVVQAADQIRVAGRFGTAVVDSVGASAPATEFVWLHADDHCRVFAAHNPMPVDQIELGGASTELRHLPGLGGEPVAISGVELSQGSVNGALTRLFTFEIAQDTAVSFTPPSTIGLIYVFSHGSLGDPGASILTYRADALGYTQIVASPMTSTVEIGPLAPLTGTTGNTGVFTFAANSDGLIYVENRKVGTPRTLSLFVIGAPL